MRLTLQQVEVDESLPGFMLDTRYPDWIRDTRYADLTEVEYCSALMEVRRGWRDQRAFDKLIATRKAMTVARARKKAIADALPDDVKTANALRKRQSQRLARLTSAVTMHTRIVAESAAKYGETCFITANAQLHLEWARERLDAYVTASLASELAQLA